MLPDPLGIVNRRPNGSADKRQTRRRPMRWPTRQCGAIPYDRSGAILSWPTVALFVANDGCFDGQRSPSFWSPTLIIRIEPLNDSDRSVYFFGSASPFFRIDRGLFSGSARFNFGPAEPTITTRFSTIWTGRRTPAIPPSACSAAWPNSADSSRASSRSESFNQDQACQSVAARLRVPLPAHPRPLTA